MKKVNKILALSIVGMMGVTAFAGCGGSQKAENEMEIHYYRAGMGIDWLENLVDGFERTHEGYKVTIEDAAQDVGTNMDAGADIMTADLLIGSMASFLSNRQYLLPLDDWLNEPVYNSTVTLGEKLDDNLMRTMTYGDGEEKKTYALNWANMPSGLFYNKSLFDSMGYEIPRTSKELVNLAQTIVDNENQDEIRINGSEIKDIYGQKVKMFPFIHFNKNGEYWAYVTRIWQAQFDGIDGYYATESGNYIDPVTGEVSEIDINFAFTQGRYESMKALEACVAPTGYTYSYSNTIDHTTAQTRFLNGEAAMMANGGWMENEMKAHKIPYDFSIMKTPVLSAVGMKLNITEAQLAAVVDYVDSADYLANVINDNSTEYEARTVKAVKAMGESHKDIYGKAMTGDAIFAEVYEDRNLVFNNGCGLRLTVPNYSTRLEQTKEFLKYMYSDEGLKIIAESTKLPAPANLEDPSIIDRTGWSVLSNDVYNFLQGKTSLIHLYNVPFFTGNSLINGPGHIISWARQMTEVQPKKADDLWKDEYKQMKERWEDSLKLMNISPIAKGTLTLQFYGTTVNPIVP